MLILATIVVIVFIIIINQFNQYQKSLEENKENKENNKTNPKTAESVEDDNEDQALEMVLNQYLAEQKNEQEELARKYAEERRIEEEKEKAKEKENKNTSILATGAICIVLSAIAFVMSTWNAMSNILKTVILVMLTFVFYGSSYITREKFKLEKVSQAFFYIAMAYIPICLISISVFKLLGIYLSIYGEGKYIYFTIASILVSIIYYVIYTKRENTYLLIGSILSQAFSIVCFSLMNSNDILIMGINLLLYNILLINLTKKDIFKIFYNIIPTIIAVILIPKLATKNVMTIFVLMLLAINFIILEFKKTNMFYSYMFNIILVTFGMYTGFILNDSLGTNISHLLVLSCVVLAYIIENKLFAKNKRENITNSSTVITILALGILHIESHVNTNLIAPYIISIIQIIILINTYMKSKSIGKNITAVLIPIYFIIIGIDIISQFTNSYHAYILFAVFTFVISEIFKKRDQLISSYGFVISHIFIILTYIIALVTNFNSFIDDVFYAILLTGIYTYSYLTTKNLAFRYIAYYTINFIFVALFKLIKIEIDYLYYIPMISTFIIMGIEFIYKEIQDEFNYVYIILSEIVSFLFIYNGRSNYEIVAIIFATIIIIDNIIKKRQKYNVLPLICVIPALFMSEWNIEVRTCAMLLSVMITTIMSLKEENISIFTIFSGTYLFLTTLNIENIYLNEIQFIYWSMLQYLFKKKDQEKDIFQFLLYLSILILYNSIVADLGLKTYTVFSMLGYVLFTMFVIRKILIKFIKNVDSIEYLVFGFMYLSALLRYSNETDGILFGILIVAMIFISYKNKYGALFMTSIFAILVNVFVLTRKFWFSMPWWMYLLIVGIILISFATKNEINDKKIDVIKTLKNIKEKIEN